MGNDDETRCDRRRVRGKTRASCAQMDEKTDGFECTRMISRRVFENADGPKSPEESIGWYLSLYWPAMDKEFKGIVQKYDHDSKHHTVKWDNAPKGSDGVTEVDLTEGELTWLKAPEKPAKKAKAAKPAAGSKKRGGKVRVIDESMEELEARFSGKTTKSVAFQVLKDSGPEGMSLADIVEASQRLGLRDWSACKQPKTTINVCISQDAAFVKVAPGRYGLRANGAVELDESAKVKKPKAAASKKRPKADKKSSDEKKAKKVRTEPQHWERKPPIECDIKLYKDESSYIANASVTVPYNSSIKQLKKTVSAQTKGQLRPQFQKIYHSNRRICLDDDAFLVHAVRPTKIEQKLALKLVISAD